MSAFICPIPTKKAAVFCEIEPIVGGLFGERPTDGLIVLQGASGAGKTFTGMGLTGAVTGLSRNAILEGDGILPRALKRIYQQVSGSSSSGGRRKISVRGIEVYNNKAYDLLKVGEVLNPQEEAVQSRWKGGVQQLRKDKDGSQSRQPLDIKQGKDGEDVIPELTAEFPPDFAAALGCAKKARSRAQVNRTRLNDKSSRGHVLFFLGVHDGNCSTVADIPLGDPVMVVCDLAGSERRRAALQNDSSSNASSRASEANHINRDISNLFAVWKLVNDGARFVSCRGRTLTRLLKRLFVRPEGSPGMNCTMIVCVNPAASEYNETQQVLTNLKNILSKVKSTVVQGPPISKRHKTNHRAGAGAGGGPVPAAATAGSLTLRTGSASVNGHLSAAEGVVAQAAGSNGQQGTGVAELRKQIERLLVDNVRLEEAMASIKEYHEMELSDQRARLAEEHEVELGETERLATQEGQAAAQELEVRQTAAPCEIPLRSYIDVSQTVCNSLRATAILQQCSVMPPSCFALGKRRSERVGLRGHCI